MGCLIVAIACERFGMTAVLELLKINNSDQELYTGIITLFKIERKELNNFLRTELKKYN